jgi:hypothetical protein
MRWSSGTGAALASSNGAHHPALGYWQEITDLVQALGRAHGGHGAGEQRPMPQQTRRTRKISGAERWCPRHANWPTYAKQTKKSKHPCLKLTSYIMCQKEQTTSLLRNGCTIRSPRTPLNTKTPTWSTQNSSHQLQTRRPFALLIHLSSSHTPLTVCRNSAAHRQVVYNLHAEKKEKRVLHCIKN